MSIFAFIQAKQVGSCSSTFRFTSSENAHCAACLCAVERCENMATAVPYPCNRKIPSRCHTRRLQSDSSVPTWAVWCDSLTVVLLPCIPTLALVLVPNTNPHALQDPPRTLSEFETDQLWKSGMQDTSGITMYDPHRECRQLNRSIFGFHPVYTKDRWVQLETDIKATNSRWDQPCRFPTIEVYVTC
jgi:hypothetical protein